MPTAIGIGISPMFQLGAQLNPPVILKDGNTAAWYDSKDLTTITKDGSNKVALWKDKLLSGHDLIQNTALKQPTWSSSGITFDANFMKCVGFSLIQPTQIYLVVKQITWTNGRYFFDGNSNDSSVLYQAGTTPSISAYAGIELAYNTELTVGELAIVRVKFHGANGKYVVNEGTVIAGNLGTTPMNGFTLGSRSDGLYPANFLVTDIIIRKIADTETDENLIYSFLKKKNKQSITTILNSATILTFAKSLYK